MKTLLLNLWAWLLLHPVEVTAFLASVLGAIAAATVANARASGKPVGWFARFVDALAIRTRQGAQNAGWSWPLLGRSVFEAAIAASMPQPIDPAPERETIAPDASGPRSSAGYVEGAVLRVIGGAALLALGVALLTGCAATQSPALLPIPPRVIDRPEYGSCVETGGKIEVPSAGAVALLTSVCWMRADSGVVAIDASEPAAVDPKDSGTSEGGE